MPCIDEQYLNLNYSYNKYVSAIINIPNEKENRIIITIRLQI